MVNACDSFQLGVVKQLLTHALRLQTPMLAKHYENDHAAVAKEASLDDSNLFLIDTPSHLQNNEPLLRTLSKLEVKSFNLEVKVSGAALLIWAAKEKEESCSYSPFSIEVLTTKGVVRGEGWLPNSTFISGHGQQERYVAAFDYIKMQYDDSPVLLNENATHGCVVRICIVRDVFLQTVNDKGYGQNGNFEFVFKMMYLHLWVLPKQRNSGKSHYPLVITWFEYCWRSFPTLCSQLNLVYDREKIGFKGIWVLVMLVYDRGKFWSSSIWVSEEVYMVHTIDQFNSRDIETSEEYQKELIFPAYEFHLCNRCEDHVQVYNVKFKAFKQAGRLQGVDVVMCMKGLISPLPMCADFSLFQSVKDWQEHVKMCDNCGYFLPTPFVEMYEADSHVSSCGICDQFSTKYGGS
jgi:hypothetical protein